MRFGKLRGNLVVVVAITELMPLINVNKQAPFFGICRLRIIMRHQSVAQCLGVFSTDNGIMKFTGENADTKNAVVNWGIAALVYLGIGRLLQRWLGPRK
jgi:hypothetical protein